MRRIETRLEIDIDTLNGYGQYVDKIVLPEIDAYIALTVVKALPIQRITADQITATPPIN